MDTHPILLASHFGGKVLSDLYCFFGDWVALKCLFFFVGLLDSRGGGCSDLWPRGDVLRAYARRGFGVPGVGDE